MIERGLMRRIGIAGVAVLLGLASSARGQSPYSEGRALEFRTDLPWARLIFEGGDEIAGVSPLRVPGPLAGDFWLSARGPGVEPQRGRIRVRLDEEGSRIVSYGGLPLHETLLRSALWPGYPQLRSRQAGKGVFLALAGGVSVGGALWAQSEFWQAEDSVSRATRARELTVSVTDRRAANQVLRDAIADRDYREGRRNLFLGVAGAAWGLSLVDALIFAPDFDVTRADENSLTLGMKRRRRFDAVLRSAVLPGLGQEYNGQRGKAIALGLGTLAVGAWAIVQQDRYDDAVHDLDKMIDRYDNATTVSEKDELLVLRKARLDDVDDAYRDRNIAAIVVLAYWTLNVADAALSFGDPWGGLRTQPGGQGFGLRADPGNGRLSAVVRF